MKTLSTRVIPAALALLLALTGPAAEAATVRGFSLAGLTASADEIVRGTVIGSHSIWHRFGDQPERLYTVTEIRVSRSFKGATPLDGTLFIMQRGGHDAGLSQTVSGTVRFDDGDEVIVFARSDGAMSYLVGMAQGAYFLTRPKSPAAGGSGFSWARGPQPTIHGGANAAPNRPDAPDVWQANALEVAIAELVAAKRSAP